MSVQTLFLAVVATCLLNGLASPLLAVAYALYPVWLPELLPATREVVFYGASLIVSTATLLISAVPAAVAERAFRAGDRGVMLVWLLGAGLITVPGLLARMGAAA